MTRKFININKVNYQPFCIDRPDRNWVLHGSNDTDWGRKFTNIAQSLFQLTDFGGHGPHGEVAVLRVVEATDPALESVTHLYPPMEETIALVLLLTQNHVTR